MFDFLLPDIGEGISEATVIEWSVKAGDVVEEGEDLVTMSTDKVNVDLPSPRAGRIVELCGKPGETLKVGSVIVRIDVGGSAAQATLGPATKEGSHEPGLTEGSGEPARSTGSAPPAKAAAVIAAPSTRMLASKLGVDLNCLTGSGPGGQITRADVEQAARNDSGVAVTAEAAAEGSIVEPITGVRLAMGERLSHSVHVYAHSTINFELVADGLVALADRLRREEGGGGPRVSKTALLAKCVCTALERNRRLNATVNEEKREITLHSEVNLGMALASERGLVVPVLRRANTLALRELARALDDLVRRGREGNLGVADFRGGTFTLSNTGPLETARINATRPIVNPPQLAILWMSRIALRPRVIDGQLGVGPMICCSLSFDHRYIDGAEAIAFINSFSDCVDGAESMTSK